MEPDLRARDLEQEEEEVHVLGTAARATPQAVAEAQEKVWQAVSGISSGTEEAMAQAGPAVYREENPETAGKEVHSFVRDQGIVKYSVPDPCDFQVL